MNLDEHPYRPLHHAVEDAQPAPPPERGLAVLLIALGLLRVAPAIVTHEVFGAEATAALALIAVGFVDVFSVRRFLLACRRRRQLARASRVLDGSLPRR